MLYSWGLRRPQTPAHRGGPLYCSPDISLANKTGHLDVLPTSLSAPYPRRPGRGFSCPQQRRRYDLHGAYEAPLRQPAARGRSPGELFLVSGQPRPAAVVGWLMERRVPFYALILAIVGAALIRNTAWAPGKPASQPLSRDSTPTAARVPTSDDAARVRNAHCGAAPEPLKPLCHGLRFRREQSRAQVGLARFRLGRMSQSPRGPQPDRFTPSVRNMSLPGREPSILCCWVLPWWSRSCGWKRAFRRR